MFRKKSFVSFVALLLMTVLLLPAQLMAADTVQKTFTIVHTNDTHSRVEEDAGMGFAKIATKINEIRSAQGKENVIVLDAGDSLHGLPIATTSKGESITKIFNAVGYDAMVPGNHDFNYGQERLVELKGMLNFPVISANVKKADGTTLFTPYIIKEVAGLKVGIFGLCTPETTYLTHPKNVTGLSFEDPIAVAKNTVAELGGKADVIIALSHIGLDESSTVTSEAIANSVEGIDLIVDGHSHTSLPEGKKVKDTLIVQTGDYDKALGIVTVTVDADKKVTFSPSLYTKEEAATATPDQAVTDVIAAAKTDFEALTSEKIGSTPIRLEGERAFVRTGETNLGNLIINAMLDTTGADIALTNGGGIRASIEAGDITKKDIISVLPFGNYIATLHVTGQEIKDALEVGVKGYPEAAGSFPHVGNLTFTLDANKEAGNRVSNVQVKGKALDLTATYSLATNDFIAAGGDGYTMFGDNAITGEYPGLDEVTIQYINEFGVKDIAVANKITVIPVKEAVKDEASQPETVAPSVEATKEEPAQVETVEVTKGFTKYVIQYGDTLAKLAKKAGTTYQELAKINNIANPNVIFAGTTLLIPAN